LDFTTKSVHLIEYEMKNIVALLEKDAVFNFTNLDDASAEISTSVYIFLDVYMKI